MTPKLISTLTLVGVVLFSGASASAAELFRTEDQTETLKVATQIDDEYRYRTRIEGEAGAWARELMYMYRWNAKYPTNSFGFRPQAKSNAEYSVRIQAEFAWMLIAGHGAIATFDFQHAEQTLAGSTSRFVSALFRSKTFWVEVRNQCIEIETIKKESGQIASDAMTAGTCAERLRRDMTISQFVGSNASLFIGGGIVIGLGKKLFERFAAKWFIARVLPLIPAFARTKWALAAMSAAIIIVPAGFVVAGISQEHESNKVFLDDLQTSLKKNTDDTDRASVLRLQSFATEREVLLLAQWIGRNMPKAPMAEAEATAFAQNLKFIGPSYHKLLTKRLDIETHRNALEAELSLIPGISAKLLDLAELRKHGSLSPDDAELFRKAQYLASLRLVLKALPPQ